MNVCHLFKNFCIQLDDDFDAVKFEKQMAVVRGQILNLIKALKEKKSPCELVKL